MSYRNNAIIGAAICAIIVPGAAKADMFSLYEADDIEKLAVQGNDFESDLAREYQKLSLYERDDMVDWPDAEHFARKALVAAQDKRVSAEQPTDWDIGDEAAMRELEAARTRLYQAYDNGARENAPLEAAIAQVSYDCWVEQQEEGWQTTHIAACRDKFNAALDDLHLAMQTEPQQQATAMTPIKKSIVFFDFDSAALEPEALQILDNAAMAINQADDPEVTITGHADRSGPIDYNKGLSMERATAVQDYLATKGVKRDTVAKMTIRGMGESDNMVPTADGVREPANRRVEIDVEAIGPAYVSALPEQQ
jgi:OmpA-OmpF porin, OOP family